MAAEKIKACVLKTLPYRESSGIFNLLTQHQGVVHGIAKGIRKKTASASFLERGFLIETIIYVKPNRDLHTLGDCHVLNYFPNIRKDLVKSALRDAAFETILTNVSTGFPYPELFALVERLLGCLEQQQVFTPALLWSFYAEFSSLQGFKLNSQECLTCKKKLSDASAVYLVIEKGGFTCEKCVGNKDLRNQVPLVLLQGLTVSPTCTLAQGIENLPVTEGRRITRLLASYCYHHCENCSEQKALEFLDTVLFSDEVQRKKHQNI